jgi:hypothetical protein
MDTHDVSSDDSHSVLRSSRDNISKAYSAAAINSIFRLNLHLSNSKIVWTFPACRVSCGQLHFRQWTMRNVIFLQLISNCQRILKTHSKHYSPNIIRAIRSEEKGMDRLGVEQQARESRNKILVEKRKRINSLSKSTLFHLSITVYLMTTTLRHTVHVRSNGRMISEQ